MQRLTRPGSHGWAVLCLYLLACTAGATARRIIRRQQRGEPAQLQQLATSDDNLTSTIHFDAGEFTIHGTPVFALPHASLAPSLSVSVSATVLAKHLEHAHPNGLSGATVLELGAGHGIPGFAAAALGAHIVYLTDTAEQLAVASHSVAVNTAAGQGKVQVQVLDWREPASVPGAPDLNVILGADLVTAEPDIARLLHTLQVLTQHAVDHGPSEAAVADAEAQHAHLQSQHRQLQRVHSDEMKIAQGLPTDVSGPPSARFLGSTGVPGVGPHALLAFNLRRSVKLLKRFLQRAEEAHFAWRKVGPQQVPAAFQSAPVALYELRRRTL